MYKTDYLLGTRIHQLLKQHNLENKVDFTKISLWQDTNHQQNLSSQLSIFLDNLGLHENLPENNKTSIRLLDFFINDRFSGLNYQNFPAITKSPNEFKYSTPLIARNIPLLSTCEHHLVPIEGNALIAYCPKDYLIGLNKLNLVLNFFAKRPQLQERLTKQVFISLASILETDDIAIIINAKHNCMNLNHIDNTTTHSTYELGGVFSYDNALKSQILAYMTN